MKSKFLVKLLKFLLNKIWGFTGIGRRFFSISFNFHTTCNSDNSFSSGQIGNVDKGIIEGGQNVGNGKDGFSFLLKINIWDGKSGITPIAMDNYSLSPENRLDQWESPLSRIDFNYLNFRSIWNFFFLFNFGFSFSLK